MRKKIEATSDGSDAPRQGMRRAMVAAIFLIAVTAVQILCARIVGTYILNESTRGTAVPPWIYQGFGLVSVVLFTWALRPSVAPVPTRGTWLLVLIQLIVGIGIYISTIMRAG